MKFKSLLLFSFFIYPAFAVDRSMITFFGYDAIAGKSGNKTHLSHCIYSLFLVKKSFGNGYSYLPFRILDSSKEVIVYSESGELLLGSQSVVVKDTFAYQIYEEEVDGKKVQRKYAVGIVEADNNANDIKYFNSDIVDAVSLEFKKLTA